MSSITGLRKTVFKQGSGEIIYEPKLPTTH